MKKTRVHDTVIPPPAPIYEIIIAGVNLIPSQFNCSPGAIQALLILAQQAFLAQFEFQVRGLF